MVIILIMQVDQQ